MMDEEVCLLWWMFQRDSVLTGTCTTAKDYPYFDAERLSMVTVDGYYINEKAYIRSLKVSKVGADLIVSGMFLQILVPK